MRWAGLMVVMVLAGCSDKDDNGGSGEGSSSGDGSETTGPSDGGEVDSGLSATEGGSGSTDPTSGVDTGSTGSTDAGSADTGGSTGAIEDCDDLIAAFLAETEAIRSCQDKDECGQELTGTSCGCTRNWVARNDADTTKFYSLIEVGSTLGCELGLGSSCDCPATDGFVCDAGVCDWNYS